jgi:CubicO group peptidase (beta-lactamase class C family)
MSKVKRLSFVSLAGMIILVITYLQLSSLQTAPANFDPKATDALVAEKLKAGEFVGLSLAVMRDGRITLAKGYGVRSLENPSPVTEETMFAIGSVTKQFTSACVFLLAEEGKLSVLDKVAKYYPNLTRANDITLLDLMNHVSGYPDYYPLDFVDRRMLKEIAVDEVIRRYGTGKLDFEPGTRYSYSNTGYLILGRIVEKTSGEPFGDFLSRRILKPVGMGHTAYEPAATTGSAYALGYTSFALSPPEPAVPEAKGWISAAGGLYSTPSDLAKWDLALMDGKVLKPESFKLMTTPRKLADGRLTGYGCGLSIVVRNGETVISHNGAVSGFHAMNLMLPSTRSAVIVVSNFEGSNAETAVSRQVVLSLLPKGPAAGQAPPAKKEPPSRRDVPEISGLSAPEEAKAFFHRLQTAVVDRSELGDEFNWFLTNQKIQGAASRLKPYGEPTAAEIESIGERGGMEVSTARLTFKLGQLRTLMYRTPDGKIQQFFVSKG